MGYDPDIAPNEEEEKEEKKGQKDKKPAGQSKPLIDRALLESFADYSKGHTREIIAYVLLVLGLIFLFILPLLGQALIGIVTAVYYGSDILHYINHYQQLQGELGGARALVLICLVITFFIEAPVVFIAGALTMALKHLLVANES